jgi:hypothetical protein
MRLIHLIGAVLVLIASPAMAKDAWIVAQKSGDVRVLRGGLQPASVQVRAALSSGDIVETGANGRAMLTHGADYVVVAPGSRLLLPKEEKQAGFTRLIQQVGTMLYKVKHTGVPHFAVETPMLAAVVKGTSFSVVVDKDRAAVQVTEGVVEVSSLTGEARRLVERGVTVYVGRERPGDIIEMKPGAADMPGSGGDGETVKIESSGDVPLSTVADLTDGLVRAAPVAPVVALAKAPTPNVLAPAPSVDPAAPIVKVDETTVAPVVDIVEATLPPVVEPVVDIVEATLPPVVEPVVDIVEATLPPVVAPVVDIVETVVPPVVAPVVEIVETVVPPVVQPVVNIIGGLFGAGSNSGPGGGGGSNSGPGGGGGSNSGPGGGGGGSGPG